MAFPPKTEASKQAVLLRSPVSTATPSPQAQVAALLSSAPKVLPPRVQPHWRQARWYDACPALANAIDLLELLPCHERFKLLQQVLQQEPWLHVTPFFKAGYKQELADATLPFHQQTHPPRIEAPAPPTPNRRWSDKDLFLKTGLQHCSTWPPPLQQAFGQQVLQALQQIPLATVSR